MKQSHLFVAISLAVSSLVLVGCDKKESEADAAAQQQAQLPVVNVMPVQFQTVPMIQEFSGRTAAYEVADIRPQVTGVVDEILYPQGSMVQKDQPLYRLNFDNYAAEQAANQAAVQQAKANVNTAIASYNNAVANIESRKADYEQAVADMERLRPLVSQQAISEQQYQQAETQAKTARAAYTSAQAAAEQAKANIESAQAAVETAQAQLSSSQLDMSRTIVRSPITGMSERSNVTAGALVNANQAEPMVTISKINPIYVDISQSSADLLRLKQQQASGALQPGGSGVELILEDGSTYPVRGQLSLAEARVDQDTGAVTLRATFKNDNLTLLPGMYVKARLLQGRINNAVLLPQSAITRTPQGGSQVFVVGQDNKVHVRDVTVRGTFQGNWIVTDGLQSGERIVAEGSMSINDGQEVEVQPYQPKSTGNNSGAASGASAQGPYASQSGGSSNAPAASQQGESRGPVAPDNNEARQSESAN